MSINLLNVFNSKDFKDAGKKTSELVELTFKINPTSGVSFARAVFEDGSVLVKQVAENAEDKNVMQFPKITSISQRTEIIKNFTRNTHSRISRLSWMFLRLRCPAHFTL